MTRQEEQRARGEDISAEVAAMFAGPSGLDRRFCLVRLQGDALGDDEAVNAMACRFLSKAELATFQTFRFGRRRREWLAGRLAVKEAARRLLAAKRLPVATVEVAVDRRGKPFAAGPLVKDSPVHIAISHSGGTILGVASPQPCSLDIQEVRGSLARVAAKFVRPEEVEFLGCCHGDRLHGLGMLWAAKEALRKYVEMWPLLGFLECRLVAVTDRVAGKALRFQAVPGARTLPVPLPEVLAGWLDDKALAMVVGHGDGACYERS